MELFDDIRRTFGISCRGANRLPGGFMNALWRADSDVGALLIKQYSPVRYNSAKLECVENAMVIQSALLRRGVKTPAVYQSNGMFLRRAENMDAYMVMDFAEGANIMSETITDKQARSLGEECARLRRALDDIEASDSPDIKAAVSFLRRTSDASGRDLLTENFERRASALHGNGRPDYARALLAQKSIISALTDKFFDSCETGLCHEDFTPDNILFGGGGVSAIIDFDRLREGYKLHDVGRALISFAMHNNTLNMNIIRAFADGYSGILPLSGSDIVKALRLVWCVEAPWWISEEFFAQERGKANRFKEELVWLTENYYALEALTKEF